MLALAQDDNVLACVMSMGFNRERTPDSAETRAAGYPWYSSMSALNAGMLFSMVSRVTQ